MGQRITDELVNDAGQIPAKGQRIIFDADKGKARRVEGFGVRFLAPSKRNPNGLASFILDYWYGGRQRRITIGKYPTWSVEHARREAKALRKRIDKGEDPLDTRTKLRTAPTVKDLCERYKRDHLPGKADLGQDVDQRIIKNWIDPKLGRRKVAEIHQGDLLGLRDAVKEAAGPVHANRVLAVASKMFSLSLVPLADETDPWRNAQQGNPCKGVERYPEEGRERFFSEVELDRIAQALNSYPSKPAANLIRFVMLTGCRPGEARLATWNQIDLDEAVWTKPSSHTKRRKVHRVPLAPPAIQLLQRVRTEVEGDCLFLFPGRRMRDRDWEPLRQYRTCWEFVRDEANLAPDENGNPARVYDLRHTFAAQGAGQGLGLPLLGKLLGHTQARTTQRYAHLSDDPLRKAAEKITGSIANAGKNSDNVSELAQ